MQDFRCTKCNKKLAEYKGNGILSIKCPRCGTLNLKEESRDDRKNNMVRT